MHKVTEVLRRSRSKRYIYRNTNIVSVKCRSVGCFTHCPSVLISYEISTPTLTRKTCHILIVYKKQGPLVAVLVLNIIWDDIPLLTGDLIR